MVVYDAEDVLQFCLKIIEKEVEKNKIDIKTLKSGIEPCNFNVAECRVAQIFERGPLLMASIEYCFQLLLKNCPGFDKLVQKWMESDLCTLKVVSVYPALIYSSLLRQTRKYCEERSLPVSAPFKKVKLLSDIRGISETFDAVEDVLKETIPYSEMKCSDKVISTLLTKLEYSNLFQSADFNPDVVLLCGATLPFMNRSANDQLFAKVFIQSLLPGCCLFWIDIGHISRLGEVKNILLEFPGKLLCSPIFKEEFCLTFSSSNFSTKFNGRNPTSKAHFSFLIWQKSKRSSISIQNHNLNYTTEDCSQSQRLPGSNTASADMEMEKETVQETSDKLISKKGNGSNCDLSTILSLQSYMSKLLEQTESLILVTKQNEATLNEVKNLCQADINKKSNNNTETRSQMQNLQDTSIDETQIEEGSGSNCDSSIIQSLQSNMSKLLEQVENLPKQVESLILATKQNEGTLNELKELCQKNRKSNHTRETGSQLQYLQGTIVDKTKTEEGTSSNYDASTTQSLQSYISKLYTEVENLPKQVESLILVTKHNEATLNEVKYPCQIDKNRKSNHTRETESQLQNLQGTAADEAKTEEGTSSKYDASPIQSLQSYMSKLNKEVENLKKQVESFILVTKQNEATLNEIKYHFQNDKNRKSNHTRESGSQLQNLEETTIDERQFEKESCFSYDSSTSKSLQFLVFSLSEQMKTLSKQVESLIAEIKHNKATLNELKDFGKAHNIFREIVSLVDFLVCQMKALTATVDIVKNLIIDFSSKSSTNLYMTKDSKFQTSVYSRGKALWFLVFLFISVAISFFLW